MSDFIETIQDDRVANRLSRSIEGKHPFRRFKDELLNYPTLRQAWFRFHDEAFLEIAKEWLVKNEIEATVKTQDSKPD